MWCHCLLQEKFFSWVHFLLELLVYNDTRDYVTVREMCVVIQMFYLILLWTHCVLSTNTISTMNKDMNAWVGVCNYILAYQEETSQKKISYAQQCPKMCAKCPNLPSEYLFPPAKWKHVPVLIKQGRTYQLTNEDISKVILRIHECLSRDIPCQYLKVNYVCYII